jgi:rare lipoprotein A
VRPRRVASFYARRFHGRRTASGETFDAKELVAAHPRHPFGTVLHVTNLDNGKTVEVRVVDRGPAQGPRREGVIIDLSPAAARILDFVEEGRIQVRVRVLSVPEPDDPEC